MKRQWCIFYVIFAWLFFAQTSNEEFVVDDFVRNPPCVKYVKPPRGGFVSYRLSVHCRIHLLSSHDSLCEVINQSLHLLRPAMLKFCLLLLVILNLKRGASNNEYFFNGRHGSPQIRKCVGPSSRR